ncbi:uncharacterized protein LOC141659679 [Apium graveolens]|uniref:uncharacterized protein LOC141659679 n=1 Tax=Apium graveolens TaxID=4045 RepID=UPI003D7A50EF
MREAEYGSNLLLEKLYTESDDMLIIITKVSFGIWFARNKKVWEEKMLEPNVIMEMSSRQVNEWHEANRNMQKVNSQSGYVNVLEAKAYGVWEALKWIAKMQLKKVVIESDSSLVVQAMHQCSEYLVEVVNILEACFKIMQERKDLVVRHVKKHANRVAHNLARIPDLVGSYNLFISPPHYVLEILLSDITSF